MQPGGLGTCAVPTSGTTGSLSQGKVLLGSGCPSSPGMYQSGLGCLAALQQVPIMDALSLAGLSLLVRRAATSQMRQRQQIGLSGFVCV